MKTTRPKILVVCLLAALCAVFFVYRVHIKDAVSLALKPDLPSAKTAQDFVEKKPDEIKILDKQALNNEVKKQINVPVVGQTKVQKSSAKTSIPAINLAVPFAVQAPFGNWGMPYQEACEEASAIMAHRFFSGEELSPAIMDEEILKLVEWEKKTFGYYEDTTAAEVVRILKEYFGQKKTEVLYEFTLDDIKKAVADGYPVILLLAGRQIGNPYFTPPGPVYHAVVVKGYTQDKLITNDPGTKRGQDYLYDPQVLLDAIHEWDPRDITRGRRAIVVVKP